MRSAVYQAVCSPVRNPLSRRERTMLKAGHRSVLLRRALRRIAHLVGVQDPEAGWRLVQQPTFDNQIATLRFDGRQASLRIERTTPGDGSDPTLETSLRAGSPEARAKLARAEGGARAQPSLSSRDAAVSVLTTYMSASTKNSAPTAARTCSGPSGVRSATGSATASPTLRRQP